MSTEDQKQPAALGQAIVCGSSPVIGMEVLEALAIAATSMVGAGEPQPEPPKPAKKPSDEDRDVYGFLASHDSDHPTHNPERKDPSMSTFTQDEIKAGVDAAHKNEMDRLRTRAELAAKRAEYDRLAGVTTAPPVPAPAPTAADDDCEVFTGSECFDAPATEDAAPADGDEEKFFE